MRKFCLLPLLLLGWSVLFAGLVSGAVKPKMSEFDLMTDSVNREMTAAQAEAARTPVRTASLSPGDVVGQIPRDYKPWWIGGQANSIGTTGSQRLSLDEFYARALRYSQQIKVFSDLPLIRETGIMEAAGAFDTNSFLESKFEKTNDPVGSTLTTGGADRFLQDEWKTTTGLKKRLITGTEVTLSQEVGRVYDNNSIYFIPNPQSRAELTLSVTQPLLKGAGIAYNRATMQIARIDSDVAMQEFIRQSESHLLEVARTYWALYAARVTYLQKKKMIEDIAHVADELKGRAAVDTQQTQLFRAQSTLANRRSDLVREEAAIRNAQDRLRALTSDPGLISAGNLEMIPADRLVLTAANMDARSAAEVALKQRPEIQQAFLQLRATGIREKVAKNELLPELNLILQGSLGGLDQDHFTGYGNQFTTGGPGFAAGFSFSLPLENRAARARYERRLLESRQQIAQLKTTIDTVLLEVKISAREVATAFRETQAKYEAVRAFTEDIQTLQARRDLQALQDQAQISDYLDRLIDAQDRQGNGEEEFIRAAANYQVAIVNLERAKGNLLAYENVNIVRTTTPKGLPELTLQRGPRDRSPDK